MGGFRNLRLLRQEVYKAEKDGREYALKLFPSDAEAGILATLDHPGIVKGFGMQKIGPLWNRTSYLVMEFVPGMLWRDLRIAPVDPGKLRSYCTDFVDAVEYLHSSGIAHLDLHDGNVICGPSAKIIDFGYAMRDPDDQICQQELRDALHMIEQVSCRTQERLYADDPLSIGDLRAAISGYFP